MALGYDGKLYILAFDHRGSFQKKMFGIEGEPTQEETETHHRRQAPDLRGHARGALEQGARPEATGVLVDEQFGGDIPEQAKEHGLKLAMPVEKSGQNEFDFQYGDDFGAHIEKFDPDFSKVLVRYNPDDAGRDEQAPARAAEAPGGLAARERPQVPLRAAGAGHRRPARAGRRRLRPLRRRAAPRADAARDRGDPGRRHRGRHLEDRGRRRALRLRDARRADPPRRGPRGRRLRAAGPRRQRREGRPLAARRPRRWRASSASRSAARSGGTR